MLQFSILYYIYILIVYNFYMYYLENPNPD